MSTYYRFICKKCNKASDGIFIRQAWGWGNADIIDFFQFIMKHSDKCGHENIRISCEHDDEAYDGCLIDEDHQNLRLYFPCSNDWGEEERSKKYEEHREAVKKWRNDRQTS